MVPGFLEVRVAASMTPSLLPDAAAQWKKKSKAHNIVPLQGASLQIAASQVVQATAACSWQVLCHGL